MITTSTLLLDSFPDGSPFGYTSWIRTACVDVHDESNLEADVRLIVIRCWNNDWSTCGVTDSSVFPVSPVCRI